MKTKTVATTPTSVTPRPIPLALFLSCVLVAIFTSMSGYLHAWLPYAGDRQNEMQHLAQQIQTLPETIGPWRAISAEPLSSRTLELLECTGYLSRSYEHEHTGETVQLALLVGPAGPLVAHSPETCYPSGGYQSVQSPTLVSPRPASHPQEQFLAARFRRGQANTCLEVYYAWGNEPGQWRVSEHPRLTFGTSPWLIRLQIASLVPFDEERSVTEESHSAGQQFLDVLLPQLDVLFEPPTDPTDTPQARLAA